MSGALVSDGGFSEVESDDVADHLETEADSVPRGSVTVDAVKAHLGKAFRNEITLSSTTITLLHIRNLGIICFLLTQNPIMMIPLHRQNLFLPYQKKRF